MSSDLDIMLLGKTGAGKSKTGNSILGRNAFSSVATMQSETVTSQRDVTALEDGRILRVVDTPGVGDTRGTVEEGEKLFKDAIKDAIVSNPAGYHALIIVLRFGSRFTKEDISTMEYLKKVFGNNFIRKYCIIVMSWGDQFKNAQDDGDITVPFIEWCRQQSGDFQTIFTEVQGRVILFNNRGSKEEKNEQRRELVRMVDRLIVGGQRYTDAKFHKAQKELEKLILEKKISQIADEVQEEISLILLEKDRIKLVPDIDEQMYAMRGLMDRIRTLINTIDREKEQTIDLMKIRVVISEAQHQVEQEISSLRLRKEIEEKNRVESADALRKIAELKQHLDDLNNKSEINNAKLTQNYINVRDEIQQTKGTSLWERIKSWFTLW